MDGATVRAGLQLLLGVGVFVFAAALPEIRGDAGVFGSLTGLGTLLVRGAMSENQERLLRAEVQRLKSDPPPPPSYPPFPRR